MKDFFRHGCLTILTLLAALVTALILWGAIASRLQQQPSVLVPNDINPQSVALPVVDGGQPVVLTPATAQNVALAAPLPLSPSAQPAPSNPAHHALLAEAVPITAEFGHYPDGRAHYGLDIGANYNTPVFAPVAGTIEGVHRGCVEGDVACGADGDLPYDAGFGNHVWFRNGETGHHIILAHFNEVDAWVQVGAVFQPGQQFGLSGSTGNSTGAHVHVQVNPNDTWRGGPNSGATNAAWEFPWLRCGEPTLGNYFGGPTCP